MIAHRRKIHILAGLIGVMLGIVWMSPIFAANISEFLNIRPYAEFGGGYDDNIFQISEDTELPENGVEREDSYLNAAAGVEADLTYENRLLDISLGLDYQYSYKKYSNNTDLDDGENSLNFDFSVGSEYEEGFFRDRAKLNVGDVLSYIPIDEEEPLLPGNRTWRNNFDVGVDYNLISKPRTAFILGYSYGRIDFGDDPITVWTVSDDYSNSSDLTQDSQSHTGTANFKHALNSKLTYVLTYAYQLTLRDEDEGELTSANFSRQNVNTGVEAKLSSRMSANLKGGYSMTAYEDIGDLSQDDQDSFTAEASITANFGHRPLMTVGYKRYFTENDYGDTLLTDDLFGRFGFKVAQGLLVNLTADYILEDRDLYDDDTSQMIFGVSSEYELVKNLTILASYSYRQRNYFEQNFQEHDDLEKTTHTLSGGMQYKVSRYVLLKGMYYYTDISTDSSDGDYARNQFIASGRVIF